MVRDCVRNEIGIFPFQYCILVKKPFQLTELNLFHVDFNFAGLFYTPIYWLTIIVRSTNAILIFDGSVLNLLHAVLKIFLQSLRLLPITLTDFNKFYKINYNWIEIFFINFISVYTFKPCSYVNRGEF